MSARKVTFKGAPLTLLGPELKAGDKAPSFTLVSPDLKEVSLEQFRGKTVVLSVTPSLDTSVCDKQARAFNEEAKKHPNIAVIDISVDLPFAQDRWAKTAHCTSIQTLSDYRDRSFGTAYGVLIKELQLLSRSVFVLGPDQKIRYVEYVKEITDLPNFDAILKYL